MTGHDDTRVICPLAPFPAGAQVMVAELVEELGWYERAAGRVRLWFRGAEAGRASGGGGAAGRGAEGPAVVVPGVRVLFQFHERWASYRWTAETLRRERHLYLARPGACPDVGRDRLLAGRSTGLLICEAVGGGSAAGRGPGAPR